MKITEVSRNKLTELICCCVDYISSDKLVSLKIWHSNVTKKSSLGCLSLPLRPYKPAKGAVFSSSGQDELIITAQGTKKTWLFSKKTTITKNPGQQKQMISSLVSHNTENVFPLIISHQKDVHNTHQSASPACAVKTQRFLLKQLFAVVEYSIGVLFFQRV